jgi:DNA-binding HxlR family transcriptional regulator
MKDQPCFPSCATRSLLDLLSEKWVLLVLQELSAGTVRFLELQRRVGPVSEKSLTQTLRRLERSGVVRRTVYPEVPPRVEYDLTESGASLHQQVSRLRQWADANASWLVAESAKSTAAEPALSPSA